MKEEEIIPTNIIEGRWKDKTKKIMTAYFPEKFDVYRFDGYRFDLIHMDVYLTHLNDIDSLIKFLQITRASFMALGTPSPRDLESIKNYLKEDL